MVTNESKEDYLERILVLEKKGIKVRSIDIVNEMGFSKPSVSIAMKKLESSSLIYTDENHYIHLTDEGKKIAENIYKRELLLKEVLMAIGVSEDQALEDACKMEHDLSNESIEALKKHFRKEKDANL